MVGEYISQKFRLKNIEETKNYFIKEINQNELMRKNHKQVSNYIEYLLLLASAVTVCVSISAFASLVGIPIGIMSSAVGIKIIAITAGIRNYKSIIKEKEKNMIKLVLLAKTKLNNIEFLISDALIDSLFVAMNFFSK